jgi:hypothetical protein
LRESSTGALLNLSGSAVVFLSPGRRDMVLVEDGRAAIGSHADWDTVTFNPGNVGGSIVYDPTYVGLSVNDALEGDLSTYDLIASLDFHPGYRHTGIADAAFNGIFCEVAIHDDSTGPLSTPTGIGGTVMNGGSGDIGTLYGLLFYPWNFGSSDIGNIIGAFVQPIQDGGGTLGAIIGLHCVPLVSTSATLAIGVEIDGDGLAGTLADVYGLRISDHSGKGSGDSYNIYSRGASSLNVFEGRVAAGNYADNLITTNPGDPTLEGSSAFSVPLVVNQYDTGDLAASERALIVLAGGLKHTGVGVADPVRGLNLNYAINTDSTGDFGSVYGLGFNVGNFGSGDIAEFIGINAYVDQEGSGTITDMLGLWATVDAYTGIVTNAYAGRFTVADNGTAYTNVHGVYIDDCSGQGSTTSNNITSKGASSKNVFEGTIDIGHATDTTLSRASAGVLAVEGNNILTTATGHP